MTALDRAADLALYAGLTIRARSAASFEVHFRGLWIRVRARGRAVRIEPADEPSRQLLVVLAHQESLRLGEVQLATGGYARGVRCPSQHRGNRRLYVAADGLWGCSGCARVFATRDVLERQQGSLSVAMAS